MTIAPNFSQYKIASGNPGHWGTVVDGSYPTGLMLERRLATGPFTPEVQGPERLSLGNV
jgi:hypothetical protein